MQCNDTPYSTHSRVLESVNVCATNLELHLLHGVCRAANAAFSDGALSIYETGILLQANLF